MTDNLKVGCCARCYHWLEERDPDLANEWKDLCMLSTIKNGYVIFTSEESGDRSEFLEQFIELESTGAIVTHEMEQENDAAIKMNGWKDGGEMPLVCFKAEHSVRKKGWVQMHPTQTQR